MPKIISQLQNNRFLIDVTVQKIVADEHGKGLIKVPGSSCQTVALIDTGATHSVICEEIVKNLKLESQGKINIATGSSKNDEVDLYTVLLEFPSDLVPIPIAPPNPEKGVEIRFQPQAIVGKMARVSGNQHISAQGLGAIIGIDVLLGAHITIVGGRLIMSF